MDFLLKGGGRRIVILVPEDKLEFFTAEFSRERVVIEGVPRSLERRDLFLRYVALSAVHTDSLEIIRSVESKRLSSWLIRLFGMFKIGLGFIRLLDRILTPRGRFSALIDTYKPDLVFSTDIQNENDVRLIHEAMGFGIKVVGAVRSWDNLTTKGMIRVIPDILVVPNSIVKREAMAINHVSEDIIKPIGIPHYDRYIHPEPEPREKFFLRMNLDLSKKLIIFAPIGNRYIKNNLLDRVVLETLGELDVNIIVRVPPSDYVSLDGVAAKRANIVFDIVGRGSPSGEKDRKLNEMGREDDDSLVTELSYCDVVVTGHSTITIDASIFNKPVVLIDFDETPRPFEESERRYYKCDYYRPIAKSNGVQFAESRDSLKKLTERYLNDSRLEEAGRRRIAEDQAFMLDGNATKRLADVLLSSL